MQPSLSFSLALNMDAVIHVQTHECVELANEEEDTSLLSSLSAPPSREGRLYHHRVFTYECS